ncbi:carbon monoxide dehydrogenase [Actinopolyspora erythraea]|uniref:Carbon monoxide dehydrogenase n=1 Tax=Actinopolyspora erythraea TaxID=414996 RepID=A0A099D0M4_9ACTN|nr:xanthine dehydrogenase family protein subunit M [Actinopolyspora erythraea]ASU79604.1 carbon monoxide dehydrogenase [Actinopolyspora erythraea]KGI79476.1 carbon monoxide dehydrogenase [Actinopolyspora erythraea]
MDFLRPAGWSEALEAKANHPDATPIAGGTDVMVELNFDHRRPETLLDLTRIEQLREWSRTERNGVPTVRIGAAVPYARLIEELGTTLPGLAMAARTVGSPQIRNRGTLGGNLASASPAGDGHPPLLASDAEVELESVRGSRTLALADFFTGVKRTAMAPDELIAAVHVPEGTGPQQFSKIGTRNAMVIAVCTFAVALHPRRRGVGTGLGSAAPTPRSATEAEEFLAGALAEDDQWDNPRPLPDSVTEHFGELVARAAAPIDDVRGTAGYRTHALHVLARRTLSWAWNEYRSGTELSGRQRCA